MSWIGQVYFYVFAAFALFGALAAVVAANPIRGAMGLMVMILSIAALYLGLSAQFLAAIQLIVYAGAVVVLFLFVIMLLGPDAHGPKDGRGLLPRVMGGGLFAVAALGALTLAIRTGKASTPVPAPASFGGVDAVGRELFTKTLVPFELSTALLMVAVLGSVAVARGKQVPKRSTEDTSGASEAS